MGLMRRIPPKHTETALSALLSLLPHHFSDLLSQVDQPLQVSLSPFLIFNIFLFFLVALFFFGCFGLKGILKSNPFAFLLQNMVTRV